MKNRMLWMQPGNHGETYRGLPTQDPRHNPDLPCVTMIDPPQPCPQPSHLNHIGSTVPGNLALLLARRNLPAASSPTLVDPRRRRRLRVPERSGDLGRRSIRRRSPMGSGVAGWWSSASSCCLFSPRASSAESRRTVPGRQARWADSARQTRDPWLVRP